MFGYHTIIHYKIQMDIVDRFILQLSGNVGAVVREIIKSAYLLPICYVDNKFYVLMGISQDKYLTFIGGHHERSDGDNSYHTAWREFGEEAMNVHFPDKTIISLSTETKKECSFKFYHEFKRGTIIVYHIANLNILRHCLGTANTEEIFKNMHQIFLKNRTSDGKHGLNEMDDIVLVSLGDLIKIVVDDEYSYANGLHIINGIIEPHKFYNIRGDIYQCKELFEIMKHYV